MQEYWDVIGHDEFKLLSVKRIKQYRGYDSAEIVIMDEWINTLVNVLDVLNLRDEEWMKLFVFAGIGHTRVGQHTDSDENNAHPHQSQSGRLHWCNGVIRAMTN